jgi:hypothetical protein
VCRTASLPCDVAESCDGVSGTCPSDEVAAAGTGCRAAAGDCDLPEACDGLSSSCPGDAHVPDGSGCGGGDLCGGDRSCEAGSCVTGRPVDCDDHDACTADACHATAGCVHEPIEGCCDADEDCDDGDPCTDDSCAIAARECVHEASMTCGPDAGPGSDGGAPDPDGGVLDADGGLADGGGVADAGRGDASADAASPDASMELDAAPPDDAGYRATGGGITCRAAPSNRSSADLPWAVVVLALAFCLERGRRRVLR